MTSARLLRSFVAAASLAGAALAGEEPSDAGPELKREIRVRIACDEEFQRLPEWERLARGRLAAASSVYEKRFGIRWRAVDVVSWKSDDLADSLLDVLGGLELAVPRGDVDVVVGFSGQTRAKGGDRAYAKVGQARFYGPAAVVRQSDAEWSPSNYVGTLAHELGHVLGAWHCASRDSVMYQSAGRRTCDCFDAQSAAAVEVARGLDFARGVGGLSADDRRRLGEIYRAGHERDVALPYVEVERDRALKTARTDAAAGRDLFRRALAEQETFSSPDDPSLVTCLRMLAGACLRAPGGDLEEAERLARRAIAITEKSGVADDPPLAPEYVLAEVESERGRRDEATALYRRVYDARLKELGASHSDTKRVKDALDDLRRPWIDIVVKPLPALADESDLAFESPRPGTIHVRPVREAAAPSAGFDAGVRAFEVAVPSGGTLTLRLIETGAAASAQAVSAKLDASGTTVVGFEYASIEAAAGAAPEYAGELFVREGGASPRARFGCAAAAGAAVCLVRELPIGASGFARLPDGPSALFGRQWVETKQGDHIGLKFEDATVVVNGVRVGADGVGAKRAWRLELTFVPEEKK